MDGKRTVAQSPAWNLALTTLAFIACFSVRAVIAPLAKKFQTTLGLSGSSRLFVTAAPVVLGSLPRVPVGMLSSRFGGRRMLLYAALPFSRIVHAWSDPFRYPGRRGIVCRRRYGGVGADGH